VSYFWARWLPDALQSDPFVADRLVVLDGWENRGRPPSSTMFLPSGIVDHHTACMIREGHDPQSCINGIIAGNSVAPGPISQLLGTFTPPGVRWNGSNPDPRIVLIAAGRANHAGTGIYPWGAPGGNGSSIGVEWCGPPAGGWPDVVVELRARVDAAILRWNGWSTDQLTTHWEYATPRGRKIDQSGAHRDEPTIGQLQPWNPDRWRARVASVLAPPPIEIPPPEDDEVTALARPAQAHDTRETPAGVLKAGEVRRIPVWVADITQAELILTVIGPPNAGYLTVWGEGADPPKPATVAYNGGPPDRVTTTSTLVAVRERQVYVRSTQACHLVITVAGVS
jgi:hypothetical protein